MTLNGLRIDAETLGLAYRLFGREPLKRVITVPTSTLTKIAARNKDEIGELIGKRDRAVEAVLDFAEEVANLDDD